MIFLWLIVLKMTLNVVHNLGGLYPEQSNIDGAEEMFKRALQGFEEASIPEQCLHFKMFANLGYVYADQGKPDEGVKMGMQALQMHEEALSPDLIKNHMPALDALFMFGDLYYNSNPNESRKWYTKTLAA